MTRQEIKTLNDLKRFILAIINAHGNMISTSEAAIAIEDAFKEYEANEER